MKKVREFEHSFSGTKVKSSNKKWTLIILFHFFLAMHFCIRIYCRAPHLTALRTLLRPPLCPKLLFICLAYIVCCWMCLPALHFFCALSLCRSLQLPVNHSRCCASDATLLCVTVRERDCDTGQASDWLRLSAAFVCASIFIWQAARLRLRGARAVSRIKPKKQPKN